MLVSSLGGSTGIGAATAQLLASRGVKVVISARDDAKAADTLDAIRQAGGDVLFVQADVSVEADVERLVAATVSAHGRLDLAFNNARIRVSTVPIDKLVDDLGKRCLPGLAEGEPGEQDE